MITQVKNGWFKLEKNSRGGIGRGKKEVWLSLNKQAPNKDGTDKHRLRIGIPDFVAKACGFILKDKLNCEYNPSEGLMRIIRSSDFGYMLSSEHQPNERKRGIYMYCVSFPIISQEIKSLLFPSMKPYSVEFETKTGELLLKNIGRGKISTKNYESE